MSQQILSEIARRLDVSESELAPVFETVIQRIQQQVANYGYARLAGLGTFRGRDGDLTFEPDAVLTETANLPYAGLEPIRLGRPSDAEKSGEAEADVSDTVGAAGAAAWSGEQLPEEHTLAEFEDDEAEEHDSAMDDEASDFTEDPWADTSQELEEDEWDDTSDELDEEEWYDAAEDWDDEVLDEPSDEWEDDWEDEAESHPLGPLPAEEFEDADYSVVEDERGEEPLPKLQFEDHEYVSDKDEDIEAATASTTAEDKAGSPETVKPEDDGASAEDSGERDRKPRPHESIRRDWPSERAGRSGLDGTASRRNTILIGAGLLIIIAAAAVGYFSMQPAEPTGTEIASEAEDPQTTAPGVMGAEDAQAADTSAGAAAPTGASDELEGSTEAPASPASTPLRSPDGIDTAAGGFTIVVYSETSEASAGEVAQEYGDEGFRSDVVASQEGGVTRYRVGIGQFETLEEAIAARNQLAGSELPDDAWVYGLE